MNRQMFKNMVHHIHIPDRHSIAVHGSHLIHEPRFWFGVIIAALLTALIVLALFMPATGQSEELWPSNIPMYPYGY